MIKRAIQFRSKKQLKRKGKPIMKRLGPLVLCIGVPVIGALEEQGFRLDLSRKKP